MSIFSGDELYGDEVTSGPVEDLDIYEDADTYLCDWSGEPRHECMHCGGEPREASTGEAPS